MPANRTGGRRGRRRAPKRPALLGDYLGYAATFAGAGLTRSRPSAGKVCGVVAASLALSFGIGMLSGGLQHFEDFPERAAMLIPFGLALSFVSYVLRHQPARWRSILGPAGVLVAVTAAVIFLGLKGIAQEMATESGGDGHGHSHGEEPGAEAEPETGGADGHQHESGSTAGTSHGTGTAPSSQPTREPTATAPASQEAAEDHGEAGHSH